MTRTQERPEEAYQGIVVAVWLVGSAAGLHATLDSPNRKDLTRNPQNKSSQAGPRTQALRNEERVCLVTTSLCLGLGPVPEPRHQETNGILAVPQLRYHENLLYPSTAADVHLNQT